MESKRKAGSYIERYRKVLSSWLSYNRMKVELKVNIRGKSETPTLNDERVPTASELSKILRMSSPRTRISVALMAFSGLRPESLGNHLGTDGLVLGDFKEARLADQEGLVFEKSPTLLVVRSGLSKARHEYFTFVGEEASTYVEDYLLKRIEDGEKLNPQSPLLWFDPRGPGRKNNFLRSSLVERDIREAFQRAEFKGRPYVLRSYCDTNLIISESKNIISHPYLQFIMGHRGDIEARYSTNKRHLPPDMVDGMRESYRKSLRFLQTIRAQTSEEEQQMGFKRQVLVAVGFKDDEIEKMDLGAITDVEYQARVRERLLGKLANNGARQKVVKAVQVEEYISQGWEYVGPYPDDKKKAIIKLPA